PRSHLLARAELKKLNKIICTTDRMAAFYQESGRVEKARIMTLYGGVSYDIHDARKVLPEVQRSDADLVIGMLGRASAVKGQTILIQALAKVLAETDQKVILRLAGGGDPTRRGSWQALANELAIPKHSLEILGTIDNVPAFMRSLDVGIIPSLRSEMICRVLMEFTAFGKPILGSQVNAVGEVIGKYELGLTSPPGDAGALAANILQVLAEPALLEVWSANSRKAYEEYFNPGSFAQATEAFYQKKVDS
ncbi:glycosyltransferase family 4 protein, partial [Planctomycetota bacterium]